jgi:hypothetical protein
MAPIHELAVGLPDTTPVMDGVGGTEWSARHHCDGVFVETPAIPTPMATVGSIETISSR